MVQTDYNHFLLLVLKIRVSGFAPPTNIQPRNTRINIPNAQLDKAYEND
jgi:hypothetical protein